MILFVNDVESYVDEGTDGVEHLYCGHRDKSKMFDRRNYGFPFDRPFDFSLIDFSKEERPYAETKITITHLGLINQQKETLKTTDYRIGAQEDYEENRQDSNEIVDYQETSQSQSNHPNHLVESLIVAEQQSLDKKSTVDDSSKSTTFEPHESAEELLEKLEENRLHAKDSDSNSEQEATSLATQKLSKPLSTLHALFEETTHGSNLQESENSLDDASTSGLPSEESSTFNPPDLSTLVQDVTEESASYIPEESALETAIQTSEMATVTSDMTTIFSETETLTSDMVTQTSEIASLTSETATTTSVIVTQLPETATLTSETLTQDTASETLTSETGIETSEMVTQVSETLTQTSDTLEPTSHTESFMLASPNIVINKIFAVKPRTERKRRH